MRIFLALLLVFIASCQYNETMGKYMAQLAVCSYCRPAQIEKWDCLPCKKTFKMIYPHVLRNSTNDTLGYVAVSDDLDAVGKFNIKVVLVLRGTLPWDIKNWFTDINFLKKKYPHCDNGCEVHRGFYEAYEDIQDHVKATIENYTSTFKKRFLIVTGHSLGGALSTHAVAHLMSVGIKVDYYYSMGSPRVGDAKFAEWFRRKHGKFVARIVHWKDQVPHLPDEYWGFHHMPNEVFYNLDQSYYKVCSDTGEDPTCSNQYIVTNWDDHMYYCGVNFNEAYDCQL